MDKYVIFLDVDGTLVDWSYIPTKRVADALVKAQKAGHKIFISTARQKRTVPQPIKDVITPDGYVCTTGQYVEVEGELLQNATLSPEAANTALDIIKRKKYSCYITLNEYEINSEKGVFDEALARKDADEGRIVKFGIRETLDEEAVEVLSKYLILYQYTPDWCETALNGYNKAKGIQMVMDYYGLDISRSIAIGDSANDMEMIQAAGIGVAMGNGDPRLKAVADYVTDSVADDGVATALEKFLGI